ncbi:MAG: hypothetical protein DWQ07_18660 [Chloroflexi bacterium]|nr:MAG: hypothetical protein DWQ07_18660 [Chloroflexota bacterium]MBL1194954.1 hypothetical protein [Chloroflexota bacterium]NOH12244.1 hypothetical protein [Chloroflexota bacterium]
MVASPSEYPIHAWLVGPRSLYIEALKAVLDNFQAIDVQGISHDSAHWLREIEPKFKGLLIFAATEEPDISTIQRFLFTNPSRKVLCFAFSWNPKTISTLNQMGVLDFMTYDHPGNRLLLDILQVA